MASVLQTLRAIVSLGQSIWKIFGLIGWQPITIAILTSGAGWVIAHLQGVPTSLAAMAAIPVLVAILYLVKLPAFITGTNEITALRRPDHRLWARLQSYTIGHAACLMANTQPVENPAFMAPAALPYYQLLHQAIRNGSLPAHTPNLSESQQDPLKTGQTQPSWWVVVMRVDLQKFYAQQEEMPLPKFLHGLVE